jgi:hypothetical protein
MVDEEETGAKPPWGFSGIRWAGSWAGKYTSGQVTHYEKC